MSRMRLRSIAAETLTILDAGRYAAADGTLVDLTADLARSVSATQDITSLPAGDPADGTPHISVADGTTLDGITNVLEGTNGVPAVLNFASARNPGGGFERGADAQEEALCRDTTLFAALRTQPFFYARNKACPDAIYSDALLYSPAVRVIRDAYGILVASPPEIAVLTAPAPNLRALSEQGHWPARRAALLAALDRRIDLILRTARANGHRSLVLGAWGCGVFGNDPFEIAGRFANALNAIGGAFDHVHFAIPAVGSDNNLDAFKSVFGVS